MREILVFKMPNCAPCAQLAPIIESFEGVEFLDVMDNIERSQQYGIRNAPTVVVLEDGLESKRFSGFKTKKEIEEFLK